MKKNPLGLIMILSGLLLLQACCSKFTKGTAVSEPDGSAVTSPGVIIYQTRGDYFNYVPVILSDDKSKLVSYPDPKDLMVNGKLTLPSKLADGFLLDNRGIDQNVAFIGMTYEQYSKLSKAPSPEELMQMIVDKNPIRRMYRGKGRSAYQEIENELNTIISGGKLKNLKRLK